MEHDSDGDDYAGDDNDDDDDDNDNDEEYMLDHARLFSALDRLSCVGALILIGLVVYLALYRVGGDCGECLDGAAGGECDP